MFYFTTKIERVVDSSHKLFVAFCAKSVQFLVLYTLYLDAFSIKIKRLVSINLLEIPRKFEETPLPSRVAAKAGASPRIDLK